MLARPPRRATYHRGLWSGELIPQNERELRYSEGSGMLIGDPQVVRGAMLARPKRREPITELWGAENSILRMRGNSDTQRGVACSWVTLYGEGSNASSTTVLGN